MELGIELVKDAMEPRDLLVPGERRCLGPLRRAVRQAQGPIEQVADVRQDFDRSPYGVGNSEGGEFRRRFPQRLVAPVADGGNGVAQQRPGWIVFHHRSV